MGYFLPSSGDYGASMGDTESNDFSHYVISEMFYVDNFSQHNREMQFHLLLTFLLYNIDWSAQGGGRRRYKISHICDCDSAFYSAH